MARHLGSQKQLPLQLGEKKPGSAFFKPIGQMLGEGATDESKLEAGEGLKEVNLVKPTPVIYINDTEVHLSPMTPPYGGMRTGFEKEVDPSDEVRAIFEGKSETQRRQSQDNAETDDAKPHLEKRLHQPTAETTATHEGAPARWGR